MLIFVVTAEMFFGSDNFLGLPGNLRGGCYSSLGHFPTPPPSISSKKSHPFSLNPSADEDICLCPAW